MGSHCCLAGFDIAAHRVVWSQDTQPPAGWQRQLRDLLFLLTFASPVSRTVLASQDGDSLSSVISLISAQSLMNSQD